MKEGVAKCLLILLNDTVSILKSNGDLYEKMSKHLFRRI